MRTALFPLVLLGFAPLGFAAAQPSFTVEPGREPSQWTISYDNRPVLVYAFEPTKFKPYVKALYTLKGDNILRDSPFDHLHHHALMYGIRVNGINFWEEVSGCGVQKPVDSPEPQAGTGPGGRPQVTIRQTIHWVAAEDAFLPDSAKVALVVEQRTLVLAVDPATAEVALEWKSHFQVGGKTNRVELTGANYHGLGMRFQQSLDALAVHSLAGTRPDLSNNRQDLSAARWAAVSFDLPGHPATVVLAGHPANARGDATYFSMLTPFAYLSATQALDKEPLVYQAGDSFDLSYLVLVYPESKVPEALSKRVTAWRAAKP